MVTPASREAPPAGEDGAQRRKHPAKSGGGSARVAAPLLLLPKFKGLTKVGQAARLDASQV